MMAFSLGSSPPPCAFLRVLPRANELGLPPPSLSSSQDVPCIPFAILPRCRQMLSSLPFLSFSSRLRAQKSNARMAVLFEFPLFFLDFSTELLRLLLLPLDRATPPKFFFFPPFLNILQIPALIVFPPSGLILLYFSQLKTPPHFFHPPPSFPSQILPTPRAPEPLLVSLRSPKFFFFFPPRFPSATTFVSLHVPPPSSFRRLPSHRRFERRRPGPLLGCRKHPPT